MKQFALLIDGENISGKNLAFILNNLEQRGNIVEKCVFADFANTSHNSNWEEPIKKRPVTMVHIHPGKDATDASMMIHAAELVYLNPSIDSFCIASSDSGFTTLANHLRMRNKFVLGMGVENVCKANFISSCDEFEFLPTETQQKPASNSLNTQKHLDAILNSTFNKNSPDGALIALDAFGRMLRQDYQDFKPSDFGYENLTQIIEKSRWFKIKYNEDTGVKSLKKFDLGLFQLPEKSLSLEEKIAVQLNHNLRLSKRSELLIILKKVFQSYAKNEAISMAAFGTKLREDFKGFNIKDYGYESLSKAFKDLKSDFRLESDDNLKQPNYTIFRNIA